MRQQVTRNMETTDGIVARFAARFEAFVRGPAVALVALPVLGVEVQQRREVPGHRDFPRPDLSRSTSGFDRVYPNLVRGVEHDLGATAAHNASSPSATGYGIEGLGPSGYGTQNATSCGTGGLGASGYVAPSETRTVAAGDRHATTRSRRLIKRDTQTARRRDGS